MRKVRIGLENCEKHFQEELMMVVAQKNLREMGIKIFCHDFEKKLDFCDVWAVPSGQG